MQQSATQQKTQHSKQQQTRRLNIKNNELPATQQSKAPKGIPTPVSNLGPQRHYNFIVQPGPERHSNFSVQPGPKRHSNFSVQSGVSKIMEAQKAFQL